MASLLVAALSFVLYESMGYPILRMRFSPVLFGGLTGIVAVTILIAEVRAFRVSRARMANPEVSDLPAPSEDLTAEDPDLYFSGREAQAVGWFLALVAAFLVLGFTVGMTLFIVVFLKVYGREPWPITVALTVGTMGLIYLLFIEFLGVRVFQGLVAIPLPFGL